MEHLKCIGLNILLHWRLERGVHWERDGERYCWVRVRVRVSVRLYGCKGQPSLASKYIGWCSKYCHKLPPWLITTIVCCRQLFRWYILKPCEFGHVDDKLWRVYYV